MFGMTVGALIVYLKPRYFIPEHAKKHMAWCSFLFAIAIIVTFLIHLHVPSFSDNTLLGILCMGLTYGLISIPFIFSGITVWASRLVMAGSDHGPEAAHSRGSAGLCQHLPDGPVCGRRKPMFSGSF